jgi:3-deoxy-7-phosphoheptulonate synthase
MKDLRLVKKHSDSHKTVVILGDKIALGGDDVVMIAGPCAIEGLPQMTAVSEQLVKLGIPCLRGGAFKPRTSPYSFQGMAEEGLELLQMMKREFGLVVISEVMSEKQVIQSLPYLDCLQIGARNMQNFELLKALGEADNKPILLKRGLSATLEEFLYAAEYIMAHGNPNVILCERGIRSFDPMTRNVLDIASCPVLKELTHLPVVIDPSHATGKRSLIEPTAKAAVAVGADGILVEAHPVPEKSVSDAAQALSLPDLEQLVRKLLPVAAAVDRGLTANLPMTVSYVPQ